MIFSYLFLIYKVFASEEEYLVKAKNFMDSGKFLEALEYFDKAIELSPSNHVTFYRRASTYMILGRTELAIDDFNSVLELKKDNHQARLKRAKLLLQKGSINEAIEDANFYLASLPNDGTVTELLQNAQNAQFLLSSVTAPTCNVEQLTELIQLCPKFVDAIKRRADCHLNNNEYVLAISDLSRVIKIHPNNNALSLEVAKLYAKIGEFDNSVKAVKECLRQDPDDAECKTQFKLIKKYQKRMDYIEKLKPKKKWSGVLEELFNDGFLIEIEKLGADPVRKVLYLSACEAYKGTKKFQEGVNYCTKVLDIDDGLVEPRIIRGECYLALDEYEKAQNDFKTAHDADSQNQRIIDGYKKASALLKRAGMRDYYKILDVPRTATDKEIKKAYRKKAQEWHPDKYRGDLPAKEVEKKMSEINLAWDVLGNEERRRNYDNGEDPNDPNQQQGNYNQDPFGGFPFQGFQGFQGFGQGGGQFHFKF